jgi:GGDEF domain-containing protein
VRDFPDDRPPAGGSVPERLARAARAAQQLCDTLWDALHEELLRPNPERVRELAERLAEVSSTVAMLAATLPDANAPAAGPPPAGASAEGALSTVSPPSTPGVAAAHGVQPSTAAAHPPAFERRTPPEPSVAHPSSPATPLQSSQGPAVGEYPPTLLVDERESNVPSARLASVEPIQPEIEIRDVRREEGASAWVSSVGRLLARHAQDGLPFAVLLLEIVDVARLERSETPHDLHGLVAKVESAVGRGMRSGDHLSRETLGRYWLVAPETNGTGARMLAERLARLVRTSASHRGVPMEVAIGIAVCPDDGTEAPALAARADLGVYSARATGRSIAHTDPPPAG